MDIGAEAAGGFRLGAMDASYVLDDFHEFEYRVMLVPEGSGLGLGLGLQGGVIAVDALTPGLPAINCKKIEVIWFLEQLRGHDSPCSLPDWRRFAQYQLSFCEWPEHRGGERTKCHASCYAPIPNFLDVHLQMNEMLASPSVFLGFMRGKVPSVEDDDRNLIIHDEWAEAHATQPLIGVYGNSMQKKGAQQQMAAVHQISDDQFVMRGDDPDVQAFQAFDPDSTGLISMAEVPAALLRTKGREVPESAIDELVLEMQLDPNGWLTLLEFKHLCTHCHSPDLAGNTDAPKKKLRKKSTLNGDADGQQREGDEKLRKKSWSAQKHEGDEELLGSEDEQAILSVFHSYDTTGNGFVSLSHIEPALARCGVAFETPQQFRSWLVMHEVSIDQAAGTEIDFPKFHSLVQTGRQACTSSGKAFSSILTNAKGPKKDEDEEFQDAKTSADHDDMGGGNLDASAAAELAMLGINVADESVGSYTNPSKGKANEPPPPPGKAKPERKTKSRMKKSQVKAKEAKSPGRAKKPVTTKQLSKRELRQQQMNELAGAGGAASSGRSGGLTIEELQLQHLDGGGPMGAGGSSTSEVERTKSASARRKTRMATMQDIDADAVMDAAAGAKPLSLEELMGGIDNEEAERVRKKSLQGAMEINAGGGGHELQKDSWLDAEADPYLLAMKAEEEERKRLEAERKKREAEQQKREEEERKRREEMERLAGEERIKQERLRKLQEGRKRAEEKRRKEKEDEEARQEAARKTHEAELRDEMERELDVEDKIDEEEQWRQDRLELNPGLEEELRALENYRMQLGQRLVESRGDGAKELAEMSRKPLVSFVIEDRADGAEATKAVAGPSVTMGLGAVTGPGIGYKKDGVQGPASATFEKIVEQRIKLRGKGQLSKYREQVLLLYRLHKEILSRWWRLEGVKEYKADQAKEGLDAKWWAEGMRTTSRVEGNSNDPRPFRELQADDEADETNAHGASAALDIAGHWMPSAERDAIRRARAKERRTVAAKSITSLAQAQAVLLSSREHPKPTAAPKSQSASALASGVGPLIYERLSVSESSDADGSTPTHGGYAESNSEIDTVRFDPWCRQLSLRGLIDGNGNVVDGQRHNYRRYEVLLRKEPEVAMATPKGKKKKKKKKEKKSKKKKKGKKGKKEDSDEDEPALNAEYEESQAAMGEVQMSGDSEEEEEEEEEEEKEEEEDCAPLLNPLYEETQAGDESDSEDDQSGADYSGGEPDAEYKKKRKKDKKDKKQKKREKKAKKEKKKMMREQNRTQDSDAEEDAPMLESGVREAPRSTTPTFSAPKTTTMAKSTETITNYGLGLCVKGGVLTVDMVAPHSVAAIDASIRRGDILVNISGLTMDRILLPRALLLLEKPAVCLTFLRYTGGKSSTKEAAAGVAKGDEEEESMVKKATRKTCRMLPDGTIEVGLQLLALHVANTFGVKSAERVLIRAVDGTGRELAMFPTPSNGSRGGFAANGDESLQYGPQQRAAEHLRLERLVGGAKEGPAMGGHDDDGVRQVVWKDATFYIRLGRGNNSNGTLREIVRDKSTKAGCCTKKCPALLKRTGIGTAAVTSTLDVSDEIEGSLTLQLWSSGGGGSGGHSMQSANDGAQLMGQLTLGMSQLLALDQLSTPVAILPSPHLNLAESRSSDASAGFVTIRQIEVKHNRKSKKSKNGESGILPTKELVRVGSAGRYDISSEERRLMKLAFDLMDEGESDAKDGSEKVKGMLDSASLECLLRILGSPPGTHSFEYRLLLQQLDAPTEASSRGRVDWFTFVDWFCVQQAEKVELASMMADGTPDEGVLREGGVSGMSSAGLNVSKACAIVHLFHAIRIAYEQTIEYGQDQVGRAKKEVGNVGSNHLRARLNELPRSKLTGDEGFLRRLTWVLSNEERAAMEKSLLATAESDDSDPNIFRWVEVVRVTLDVLGIGTDVSIKRGASIAVGESDKNDGKKPVNPAKEASVTITGMGKTKPRIAGRSGKTESYLRQMCLAGRRSHGLQSAAGYCTKRQILSILDGTRVVSEEEHAANTQFAAGMNHLEVLATAYLHSRINKLMAHQVRAEQSRIWGEDFVVKSAKKSKKHGKGHDNAQVVTKMRGDQLLLCRIDPMSERFHNSCSVIKQSEKHTLYFLMYQAMMYAMIIGIFTAGTANFIRDSTMYVAAGFDYDSANEIHPGIAIGIPFLVAALVTTIELLVLYSLLVQSITKSAILAGMQLYPLDADRRFIVYSVITSILRLPLSTHPYWGISPPCKKLSKKTLASRAAGGYWHGIPRLLLHRMPGRIFAKMCWMVVSVPASAISNALLVYHAMRRGARLVNSCLSAAIVTQRIFGSLHATQAQYSRSSAHQHSLMDERVARQLVRSVGVLVCHPSIGGWHPALQLLTAMLLRLTHEHWSWAAANEVVVEEEEEAEEEQEEEGGEGAPRLNKGYEQTRTQRYEDGEDAPALHGEYEETHARNKGLPKMNKSRKNDGPSTNPWKIQKAAQEKADADYRRELEKNKALEGGHLEDEGIWGSSAAQPGFEALPAGWAEAPQPVAGDLDGDGSSGTKGKRGKRDAREKR
jgi:hypothetical protein